MLDWIKKHRIVVVLVVAAVLAASWRWTPLSEWLEIGRLSQWARSLDEYRFTPLLVMGAYVVASIVMIPVNLLVVVTAIVFDTGNAIAYAFGGSLAAAVVTFWLGRLLGRDTVKRLAVRWVKRLSQKLAKRGVLTMATIRLLPLAPFAVVNMVAGSSDVRFRDFVLGSALGMTPGILAAVILENRITHAFRNPGVGSVAIVVGVGGAVVVFFWWLRRKLKE